MKRLNAVLETLDDAFPQTSTAYNSQGPRAGRGDMEEKASPCRYAKEHRMGGDADDVRTVCINKNGGTDEEGKHIGYGRTCPYAETSWDLAKRSCENYHY